MNWVTDTRAWEVLPGGDFWDETCTVSTAKSEAMWFPPLEWTICGAGCAVAYLRQGFSDWTNKLSFGKSGRGDEKITFLRFSERHPPGEDGNAVWITRMVDVESGATLGAYKTVYRPTRDATCLNDFEMRSANAASVWKIAPSGEGGTRGTSGYFDFSDARWSWRLPLVPIGAQGYGCPHVANGTGQTFYFCGVETYMQLAPGSSSMKATANNGGYAFVEGTALGDLFVWAERATSGKGSRVRGWKPDGLGERGLVSALPDDGVSCGIGVGADRVAGLMIDDGADCYWYNSSARFWYAPLRDEGVAVPASEVHVIPVLGETRIVPAIPALVSTAVDFLAVAVAKESEPETSYLMVVRISDGVVRWIRAPNNKTLRSHVLTNEYLYFAFEGLGAKAWDADEVFRYDLSKFDTLGSRY